MRNKSYIKRGTVIDVQIKDDYFVSAAIAQINNDKTEFKCNLSIHNINGGISVEIDKCITLSSTYKTVNKDVVAKLNEMIDNGCFDNSVENIKNMLECLNALLEFQNNLRGEK